MYGRRNDGVLIECVMQNDVTVGKTLQLMKRYVLGRNAGDAERSDTILTFPECTGVRDQSVP